ncbi:CAP domain-containing protein [Streptomyces pactum]|uniref:CAP domain-containing protein n=1 Tax=Streptomyces pactum TaxID=68249 RepID=UPI0036FC580F
MRELVAGGNTELPDGPLSLRVPGPFDVSVLITGDDGRVSGDGDFVFFNQPSAPGARLRGDTVTVEPRRLRPGAGRVTVVVSPADPAAPFGRLPVPALSVLGADGVPVAGFTPSPPSGETVLLLAELYRRGTGWKLRALGQGYADGLAGVARDFGVDVLDDAAPPARSGRPDRPTVPGPAAGPTGATNPGAAAGVVAAAPGGGAVPDGFLDAVNAARLRFGVPPVAFDARLAAAARAHAEAMAARGVLGAVGPDGTSVHHRVAAAGYRCLAVAEHLVAGARTAAELVAFCLGEEGRGGPFRDRRLVHVGAGRAVGGGPDGMYWTVVWAEPYSSAGQARLAAEVIALTNAERAAAGLGPLAHDASLTAAAQAHSDDMAARDFFAHTSPEGREPWHRATAAGCGHRTIGENIACGRRTPAGVVQDWMDSPGHRANILSPDFTWLGVGYTAGGTAGTYWTQVFGG